MDLKRLSKACNVSKRVKDSGNKYEEKGFFTFEEHGDAEQWVENTWEWAKRHDWIYNEAYKAASVEIASEFGLSYMEVVDGYTFYDNIAFGESIYGEDGAAEYGFDSKVESYEDWFNNYMDENGAIYGSLDDKLIVVRLQ